MSQILDKVRAAALELPETSEKLSHGQPTFFVIDRSKDRLLLQFLEKAEGQACSC